MLWNANAANSPDKAQRIIDATTVRDAEQALLTAENVKLVNYVKAEKYFKQKREDFLGQRAV